METIVARASPAEVEQPVRVVAPASRVPAKVVFRMEAEVVASMMVAAVAVVRLPAQAPAPAPVADHVGCTAERLDLGKIIC